jgi:hypothetical protein
VRTQTKPKLGFSGRGLDRKRGIRARFKPGFEGVRNPRAGTFSDPDYLLPPAPVAPRPGFFEQSVLSGAHATAARASPGCNDASIRLNVICGGAVFTGNLFTRSAAGAFPLGQRHSSLVGVYGGISPHHPTSHHKIRMIYHGRRFPEKSGSRS